MTLIEYTKLVRCPINGELTDVEWECTMCPNYHGDNTYDMEIDCTYDSDEDE